MEIVISIVIGCLLIGLWIANNNWGTKCPVCKSTRHWSIGYFGTNKESDKVICKKCLRSTFSPESREIKEYATPIVVEKISKRYTHKWTR